MTVREIAAWLASPAGTSCALAIAFVLGSMIGSFLNVVAHRVPRGETVVFGRSHCPACGRTIRAHDNLPVIGWIALGGRCRDCGARISAIYPLVEATCGCLAAMVAAGELVTGRGGDPVSVVAAWAARTAVAMALVSWALLATRGHAISAWTAGTAVVITGLAAACAPALHPLPIGCPGTAWAGAGSWTCGAFATLAGMAVGRAVGSGLGGSGGAACTVVGAAVGWQAAILVAVVTRVARPPGQRDACGCAAAAAAVTAGRPLGVLWETACRAVAGG